MIHALICSLKIVIKSKEEASKVHLHPSMDIDSTLIQILSRQQQLIARLQGRTHAILETTGALLEDDEDNENSGIIHGGSKPGKQPNRPRDFEGSYLRLHQQYFGTNPLYSEEVFRRRFQMTRPLFLKIVEAVEAHNNYFTQKADACGQMGLHPLVKVTAALCMLAYGGAADCNDKYLQLSETTSLDCMDFFCNAIASVYSTEYLQYPTAGDLERLLTVGAKRGFPGMLGSLNCMHWKWKKCPSGWAGQFQGKEKVIGRKIHCIIFIYIY
jgi:hypothetical protein